MARSAIALTFSLLAAGTTAQDYQLIASITPSNFFEHFDLFTAPDPTNGFVRFADKNTAFSQNLTAVTNDVVYVGVDHTNVYQTSDAGRPSVRLQSKMKFTEGLFVVDLTHMPYGCGTWPAFWTVGENWPQDGEIDIIEGINDATQNGAALHVDGECSVNPAVGQTGTWKQTDCSAQFNGNVGCSTKFTEPNNYGEGFNKNGGGTYAMEWTNDTISVWFFPPALVPYSLLDEWSFASATPNPLTFGPPSATFHGPCSSSFPEKFFNHSIVFDTTFCGGWAGKSYDSSSCPKKQGLSGNDACVDFVANNPTAFAEAWWGIKRLRVWEVISFETPLNANQNAAVQDAALPVALSGGHGAVQIPGAEGVAVDDPETSTTTATSATSSSSSSSASTTADFTTPAVEASSSAVTSSASAPVVILNLLGSSAPTTGLPESAHLRGSSGTGVAHSNAYPVEEPDNPDSIETAFTAAREGMNPAVADSPRVDTALAVDPPATDSTAIDSAVTDDTPAIIVIDPSGRLSVQSLEESSTDPKVQSALAQANALAGAINNPPDELVGHVDIVDTSDTRHAVAQLLDLVNALGVNAAASQDESEGSDNDTLVSSSTPAVEAPATPNLNAFSYVPGVSPNGVSYMPVRAAAPEPQGFSQYPSEDPPGTEDAEDDDEDQNKNDDIPPGAGADDNLGPNVAGNFQSDTDPSTPPENSPAEDQPFGKDTSFEKVPPKELPEDESQESKDAPVNSTEADDDDAPDSSAITSIPVVNLFDDSAGPMSTSTSSSATDTASAAAATATGDAEDADDAADDDEDEDDDAPAEEAKSKATENQMSRSLEVRMNPQMRSE